MLTPSERATWVLNYADNTQTAKREIRIAQIANYFRQAVEEDREKRITAPELDSLWHEAKRKAKSEAYEEAAKKAESMGDILIADSIRALKEKV